MDTKDNAFNFADMSKKITRLSAQQELFCNHIADGRTQSDAYRRAYSAEKMKPSTIWTKASRLCSDVKVRARIEELRAEIRERAMLSREDIVHDLCVIARARIDDFVEIETVEIGEDGKKQKVQTIRIKDTSELTPQQSMCVEGIEPSKNGIKLRLKSSLGAYRQISDILGIYAPAQVGIDISGTLTHAQRIAESPLNNLPIEKLKKIQEIINE